MPTDYWCVSPVKSEPGAQRDSKMRLQCLRRAITAKDLERYLTYYAPRIREVNTGRLNSALSIEAWHSLHLAVNWQSGVLAPNATEIQWSLTPPHVNMIPPEVLNQAWPYFALFLNPNTSSLSFTFRSNSPVQVAALRNAAQHPNLKHFHIADRAKSNGLTFVNGYIQSFPWSHLQTLHLEALDGDSIDHLSTLPALKSLEIDELGHVERLHEYQSADYATRPDYISGLSPEAFASLEMLDLFSENLCSLTAVLQRIPPHNRIHTLEYRMEDATEPHQEHLRELLATIKYHCNSESLRNLTLEDSSCPYEWEERVEIGADPVVDISPFFQFHNLERITFTLPESVCLTPEDVSRITSSWPKLVELDTDVGFPNSRVPLLDHVDLLTLLYGCRHLEKLGLYFNATRVTGVDPVPPCLLRSSKNRKPAALVHLNVGSSPIYSPSKVAQFLRTHCPTLRFGRAWLNYASGSEVFNRMYETRWIEVAAELNRGLS